MKNILNNIFFKNLYDDLSNITKNTHINYSDIIITKINDKSHKYLKSNNFLSNNIISYINKNLNYCYEIKYVSNNDENIIIYFTKKEFKTIPLLIKKMIYVIIIIKKLFKRTHSQKLIFFETNKKKVFPKGNSIKILDSDNINTALTFLEFEHKNGDIILYRKEEAIKVLIHELIHSNLIDEKVIYSMKSYKFGKLFCTDYDVLLNESITETLACIINIFLISIINKKDLNIMYENECKYSDYICSKIKSYYKIDKMSNVLKNNNKCTLFFPQKTNVLSYYFLKNILLKNVDKLGLLLNKYTKNYKINNDTFNKEIIKLLLNNIKYLDNSLINIDDNNKSLKMSYYQLN